MQSFSTQCLQAFEMASDIVWLIPGKLAKAALPDRSDLLAWREQGIDSVVNLLEEHFRKVARDEVRFGFRVLHSPVPDFGVPTLEQLCAAVRWIDREIASGRTVLVHCYAGIGRTGVVLIAYLLYTGKNAGDAVGTVAAAGAGPQTVLQQEILEQFYRTTVREDSR